MAEPGIKAIPTPFRGVLALLRSEPLRAVERAIAAQVGARVVEDYSTASTSSAQAGMSVSGLTAAEIETLLRDHGDQIVAFGVRFLRDPEATRDEEEYPEGEEQDPSGPSQALGLGTGFGILYAIFYNFLANRTPEEFRAFLKNRRIPHHARFARELRRVFEEAQAGRA
jgi:hypothetical protein